MIPVRIEVEGFLCYRDKCAIDLEGCDLWVFSGRNGSGKSAIFDAMTYALFKAHRGGKRGAANLIHSDADGFAIALEFDLGAERYRLRRSLRRTGKAERQLFRKGADADAHWPAVPETDTDAGLDAWIAAHVGLTFETFTASVLLMQGQAEKLIGTQPRERHAILAGLVDLAKYEDLHKIADRRRMKRKAECETAQAQLTAEPEVEARAIEEEERIAAKAEKAYIQAESDWKGHVKGGEQAATWRELVAKRDEAIARRDHAREVMDDSESIGRDWDRLKELDAVLPSLREAVALRARIGRSEREAADLGGELATIDRKLGLVAALTDDNGTRLDSLASEIARDEARKAEITEKGQEIREAVERVKATHQHRQELARLDGEIAGYADNLSAQIERAEAEAHDGLEWKAALPLLKNFARDRDLLRQARDKSVELQAKHDECRAALPRIESERKARLAEVKEAESAERAAGDRNTEATTLRDALARRIDLFRGLRGAPSCDRCGQELTKEHYDDEAARLDEESRRMAQAVEGVAHDLRLATEGLAAARAALLKVETERDMARKAVDRAASEHDAAVTNVRNHEGRCRDHHDALEVSFRLQIAAEPPGDWLATTFPTREDVEDGQRRVDRIAHTQARIALARADLEMLRTLRSDRKREAEALAKIVAQPGDESAEATRTALADEYREIQSCLKEYLIQRVLADSTGNLLTTHFKALTTRRAAADKGRAVASNDATNARDQRARARSALPEAWWGAFDRATTEEIAEWTAEAGELRDKGTEALAAELPRAQLEHAQAQSQSDGFDRQIATVPISSRLTADEASSRTNESQTRLDQAEANRRGARTKLDDLKRRRDRRDELAAQARSAEASLAVAEKLANLLGRKELQRHLLREAERGIVERANPILGEISGGELQLRLLDGDDDPDHALQMEALVRTHGRTQTHDVAFLSGSQKFRVAVSLALAIGQYARGKKERPIESVVIDEGFGCLDRQGRDEMIAQLKALKGRLARIVLVSHQEDFADSFDDGYHFSVIDGATVVEPFHK